MNEILKEHIKRLPALPESAMQIEAIYKDPDATFKAMADVIEKDPLLMADILKAANSPLYGFSAQITSIAQIVSLFGMGTTRGFALASIIQNAFKIDLSPYSLTQEQFSESAKLKNALVTNWLLKRDPKKLGVLSAASFLADIGKVIISQALIQRDQGAEFKEKLAQASSSREIELEMFDTTFNEVSAFVFEHWHFDENLIDVIKHAFSPDSSLDETKEHAKILHVIMVAVGSTSKLEQDNIDSAKALCAEYGLDEDAFNKAVEIATA